MTRWVVALLMMAGLLALGACGDDSNTNTGGADAGQPDVTLATASVSGQATRTLSTCPPMKGGKGTLCLEFRTKCDDASTKVAGGTVADADMSWPTNEIQFKIDRVPDGALQLYGFLDDDESGCTGGLTTGDIYYVAGCVAVTVSGGQDVTGVTLTFDGKKM
jgi:hypothetical protein